MVQLEAEILEIHWESDVDVYLQEKEETIERVGWNWKKDHLIEEGHFSLRPALFTKRHWLTSDSLLQFKIRVSTSIQGRGVIKGTLESQGGSRVQIEGESYFEANSDKKEYLVQARIKNLEDIQNIGTFGFSGEIKWEVDIEGNTFLAKNSTQLEVYVIFDVPLSSFFPQGVWIEALRFLWNEVKIDNILSPKEVLGKIAEHIHHQHGLKYDHKDGNPRYIRNHQFSLSQYLKRRKIKVNCYDQAVALYIIGGALGINFLYISIIEPFGYIFPTSLVGSSLCNNPFHEKNQSDPLINPKDLNRSLFSRHIVCRNPSKDNIFDACAGPYKGELTLEQYLEKTLDGEATIRLELKEIIENLLQKYSLEVLIRSFKKNLRETIKNFTLEGIK